MIKIDAMRLFCPMPVIKIQDEAAKCRLGDRIEITCSDPGAMNDVPAWARIHGHRLIDAREESGLYIITIELGE